jgi:hypothetical protein
VFPSVGEPVDACGTGGGVRVRVERMVQAVLLLRCEHAVVGVSDRRRAPIVAVTVAAAPSGEVLCVLAAKRLQLVLLRCDLVAQSVAPLCEGAGDAEHGLPSRRQRPVRQAPTVMCDSARAILWVRVAA